MQRRVERRASGSTAIADRAAADLRSSGKARIEQPLRLEHLRGLRVDGKALRLTQHRLLPGDAEPCEILEDGSDILLAAAHDVDVLDAQKEAPAEPARHLEAGQRRKRMAEMQGAVGARGEAEDGRLWHSPG